MNSRKPKKRRWVCPLCEKGALGPGRPRKDNVVRYCLDCSKEIGKLVERSCPAVQRRSKRKRRRRKLARSPLPEPLSAAEEERWLATAQELLGEACRIAGMEDVAANVEFSFSRRLRTTMGEAFPHRAETASYPVKDPRHALIGKPRGGFIHLASRLFQRAPVDECRDTILHEIAHILANLKAGKGVGHRREWKEMARLIGARPEGCHDVDTTGLANREQRRFLVICPQRCGWSCDLAASTRTRWINRLSRGSRSIPSCPECGSELRIDAFRRARDAW